MHATRTALFTGALVVAVAAALVTGCKTGPASFREKFGVDTGSARITQFYFSGLGMDHAYLWVIEPGDDALIGSIVKASGLTPRADAFDASGGLSSDFPAWWDADVIERLAEAYFKNARGQYWRMWVDRQSNRLYAQWFDT